MNQGRLEQALAKFVLQRTDRREEITDTKTALPDPPQPRDDETGLQGSAIQDEKILQ